MSGNHGHFVSTYDFARKLLESQQLFLVQECGCRSGQCKRSHKELCLWFDRRWVDKSAKPLTLAQARELLEYARRQKLVARPFRDFDKCTETIGICFCCDDCCCYATAPGKNVCDIGECIEQTDRGQCNDCGLCVEVCYVGARKMADGKLELTRDKCVGCGLCVDACPVACVKMAAR